jgi:hypothetical protein
MEFDEFLLFVGWLIFFLNYYYYDYYYFGSLIETCHLYERYLSNSMLK